MTYLIEETVRKVTTLKEDFRSKDGSPQSAAKLLVESWLAAEVVAKQLATFLADLATSAQCNDVEETKAKAAELQQNAVNLGKLARWYRASEQSEPEAKKRNIRQKAATVMLTMQSEILSLSGNLEYSIQNKSTQLRMSAAEAQRKENAEKTGLLYVLMLIGAFFVRLFSSSSSSSSSKNERSQNNVESTHIASNGSPTRVQSYSVMVGGHNNSEPVKSTYSEGFLEPKNSFEEIHRLGAYFQQVADVAGEAKQCIDNVLVAL